MCLFLLALPVSLDSHNIPPHEYSETLWTLLYIHEIFCSRGSDYCNHDHRYEWKCLLTAAVSVAGIFIPLLSNSTFLSDCVHEYISCELLYLHLNYLILPQCSLMNPNEWTVHIIVTHAYKYSSSKQHFRFLIFVLLHSFTFLRWCWHKHTTSSRQSLYLTPFF